MAAEKWRLRKISEKGGGKMAAKKNLRQKGGGKMAAKKNLRKRRRKNGG
jgi:hypothetical protein